MIAHCGGTETAIECVGLGKDFGSRSSLRDISFRVDGGMTCAIVGPNGAGKTTLLKILATLVLPSRGKALVCGEDVSKAQQRVQASIGYASSEERSFYWKLTGRQNLKFFAALHGMGRAESDSRIDSLLTVLGIDGAGDRRFQEYSTGMKQALSVARGLLHDPQVILMDEPTRSLSYEASQRIYTLLRAEAEKGKAIVFATHNFAEVHRLADTAILLREGRIVASGAPKDVGTYPGLSDEGTQEGVDGLRAADLP